MEITVPLFILCSFIIAGTKCDDDDDECEVVYALKITSSVFGCDNFDNGFMDCSGLVLATEKEDDGTQAKLGGKVVTAGEISCDYDCEVNIWKMMDMGNEYMYNMKINFGKSLEDTKAPWYPIFQNLNISECPVPSNTFEIADLKLSLDAVKEMLTHDFCGDYQIEFCFMDKTNKVSCHTLDICIIEEGC